MFENLEPTLKKPALRPLDDLSIAELEAYIADMETEILRVRREIEKKTAHAQTAASFFKTLPDGG